MTALDILVLLLVGGAGVFGFKNGFVTETLSLGAWVAAIVAVKFLHPYVSLALTDVIGTESGASVLAFALIFGITMIGGKMIARAIGNRSKTSVLGSFDRILGLGFGAVKGLIGASLIFLFASLVYDTIFGRISERPAWMTESKTYPLLNASSRALVNFVEEQRGSGSPKPREVGNGSAAL
jgi:membrane protein required for colicin V production